MTSSIHHINVFLHRGVVDACCCGSRFLTYFLSSLSVAMLFFGSAVLFRIYVTASDTYLALYIFLGMTIVVGFFITMLLCMSYSYDPDRDTCTDLDQFDKDEETEREFNRLLVRRASAKSVDV